MVLRNTTLFIVLLIGACAAARTSGSDIAPRVIKNVYAYNEPGRYAGWPANGGIWGWDNEIVVSFYAGYARKNKNRYPINDDKPQVFMQSRSLDDNGKTFGEDIMLRVDRDAWDLGYPRIYQRADGKLVSAYYFNDAIQLERYIGVTI